MDYHRVRSAFGVGSSASSTPPAAAAGGGGAPGVAGATEGGGGGLLGGMGALGPTAYGSLFQHHHHHHHHHHPQQDPRRDGSGGGFEAGGSAGGGGGHSSSSSSPAVGGVGWPASPPEVVEGARGSGGGGDGGSGRGARTCLGCALADLRQVDLIFSKAVDFWGSMEFVVDVVVRRKEHSETLLRHSTSARMIAKATASLGDYMSFWQAFSLLCGRYADALGSPGSGGASGGGGGGGGSSVDGMYAWLGYSDAQLDAEELALEHAAGAVQSQLGPQQQLLLRDLSPL
jgi:hypothetical protein